MIGGGVSINVGLEVRTPCPRVDIGVGVSSLVLVGLEGVGSVSTGMMRTPETIVIVQMRNDR